MEIIFSSRRFLQKWTNKFYFTTMKPQVDLFSFVFWRKLKKPKRHFEIIWPLRSYCRNIYTVLSYFIPGLYCCEKSKNTVVAMWAKTFLKDHSHFIFTKYSWNALILRRTIPISNCNAVFLQKIFQHIVSRKVGQRKINCRVS